ncbi:hypothetical protein [Fibrella aquatilis]|uniref:Uncharacterized protein n=1 Tax=Fibrella aquatilis TaxID=2817059 RepID=A0A939GCQ3_9BACT|nr:hypothetical protein [Fibrella aquatilis]MBO0934172.1 hypothetical protein [Fibrella aquatilis]
MQRYYFSWGKNNSKSFACLDSNWKLETSFGLILPKKEEEFIKSRGNHAKYIQLVLSTDTLPEPTNGDNFYWNYNRRMFGSIFYNLSLEYDATNGISISSYFDDLRAKIRSKFLDEIESQLFDVSINFEEFIEFKIKEYICCEFCQGVMKKENYGSHLRKKHEKTNSEIRIIESNFDQDKYKVYLYEKALMHAQRKFMLLLRDNLFREFNRKITVEVLVNEIDEIFETYILMKNKMEEIEESKVSLNKRFEKNTVQLLNQVSDLNEKLSQQKQFQKENQNSAIKNSLLIADLNTANNYIKQLTLERDEARQRLENLQRFLKSGNGYKGEISKKLNIENDTDKEDKHRLGSQLDGSSGFYVERENGRFGSLSSFDNYSDDYNEKFDPQDD